MFDNLVRVFPLIVFLIIISLVFYQILRTTKQVLIFVSILFAFYIIFRYVITNVVYIFDKRTFPIVSRDDLQKYSLENGVELRELIREEQIENFCGECEEGFENESDDDDD